MDYHKLYIKYKKKYLKLLHILKEEKSSVTIKVEQNDNPKIHYGGTKYFSTCDFKYEFL